VSNSGAARRACSSAALLAALAGCPLDPAALPELAFDIPAEDAWARPPGLPPPAPGEGRIYVTNNLDDTVSVVDLDAALSGAPAVIGTVPVGLVPVEREGPHHCAAAPAGDFYFVGISNFVPGSGFGPHGVHGAGTADGHMLKVRADDHTLSASVRVDPNPGDVRLSGARWCRCARRRTASPSPRTGPPRCRRACRTRSPSSTCAPKRCSAWPCSTRRAPRSRRPARRTR
jgi:YVTN family beta-propeller protein